MTDDTPIIEYYTMREEINDINKILIQILDEFCNTLTKLEETNTFLKTRCIVLERLPQWTVLGLVLSTIYINSMLSLHTTRKIITFAEITGVLYTSLTGQLVKETIESDFVATWFQCNKLSLNYNKTTYLPLCSYKSGSPNLGGLNIGLKSKIMEDGHIKYFGIILYKPSNEIEFTN